MREKAKSLSFYTRLKWTYTIEQDSHNGKDFYIIRINELPGICTDAESIEEGMKVVKESLKAAIKLYLSNNEKIPVPIGKEELKRAYLASNTDEGQQEAMSEW